MVFKKRREGHLLMSTLLFISQYDYCGKNGTGLSSSLRISITKVVIAYKILSSAFL